jgi:hypothetical protein
VHDDSIYYHRHANGHRWIHRNEHLAERDGWELVHVWFDQKLHKEKDGHVLVFKKTLA